MIRHNNFVNNSKEFLCYNCNNYFSEQGKSKVLPTALKRSKRG